MRVHKEIDPKCPAHDPPELGAIAAEDAPKHPLGLDPHPLPETLGSPRFLQFGNFHRVVGRIGVLQLVLAAEGRFQTFEDLRERF